MRKRFEIAVFTYTHLQEDEGLQTPNFYLKFNQFNIVFLMTRDKWQCF